MNEDEIVGVAGVLHFLDDRKFGGFAKTDAQPHLFLTDLQEMEERAALPRCRSLALVAAAVFDHGRIVRFLVPPAEDAAFMDGMQRVDEGHGARQIEAGGAALLAELAQQVFFCHAGKTTANHPTGDTDDIGVFHGTSVPIR